MKEVICINIGQTGIHIGNAFWELIALEHGIQPDGTRPDTKDDYDLSPFFSESDTEKFVPRCISVDLENETINHIKTGPYRGLFQSDSLIYGKGGGCTFDRGANCSESLKERLYNKIKTTVEGCESLQGFMIFNSASGGTGSGLGSKVLEHVSATFGKTNIINMTMFPSPKLSNSVVEPYNALFYLHRLLDHDSLDLVFDNEAIYNILDQKLRVPDPSYVNINRLIAHVASSLTSSTRFEGTPNLSMREIKSNLMPYPRISFNTASYSPFTSVQKLYHEQPSVYSITNDLFDPTCTMAKCDYTVRKVIACCTVYRGDALLYDINASITNIKAQRNIQFMDYVPTGVKISTVSEPPIVVPEDDLAQVMRTGMMLMNSGAFGLYFTNLRKKVNQLYSKRAFMRWFGDMEGDLSESIEDVLALEKDYEEIGIETAQHNEEEDDYSDY